MQLVGKNGHGKSSIALILEEVIYNKNSKGIKKSDILNRHGNAKFYTISLDFDKDGVDYQIETKRGATQIVKLMRGTTDISGHTSTQTYKIIEELIGIDHKTFAQIVYQSHAGSLEFLTSPDTARKKFLIELLNLSKYTNAGEVFKKASTEISKEVAVAQGKVDTISQWINKYSKVDFNPKPLVIVPEVPVETYSEAERLSVSLEGIEKTNKRITQNNTYKQLQGKITLLPLPEKPTETEEAYLKAISAANTKYSAANTFKTKMSKLHGTCPTCLSLIDADKTSNILKEQEYIMKEATEVETTANTKLLEIRAATSDWTTAQKSQAEWEKYHQLIDTDLEAILLDGDEIKVKVTALQKQISTLKLEIAALEKDNTERKAHNNKLEVIQTQLIEMNEELEEWSGRLHELSKKLNSLNILVKTFSTTGLVAYKIENLVKDLEGISNEYLGELSGGRFQISFQISGSDKLNVIITDNGIDIDILALSGGERARVNVATLLAIRKLMQSLSQSRINLLILDETIESLDVDGKEKLIEVLLGEESLNTVLVSHGFSHALLEKIHVIKHNNISCIEE
jgi:DNA repair exonuclease SbcCD ATPase subunit